MEEYSKLREKLESFKGLPVGWDSYKDTEPPSKWAIRWAKCALTILETRGLRSPEYVVVNVNGGIDFRFWGNYWNVALSFFNGETIVLSIHRKDWGENISKAIHYSDIDGVLIALDMIFRAEELEDRAPREKTAEPLTRGR